MARLGKTIVFSDFEKSYMAAETLIPLNAVFAATKPFEQQKKNYRCKKRSNRIRRATEA